MAMFLYHFLQAAHTSLTSLPTYTQISTSLRGLICFVYIVFMGFLGLVVLKYPGKKTNVALCSTNPSEGKDNIKSDLYVNSGHFTC
jgi:hypothetical protein